MQSNDRNISEKIKVIYFIQGLRKNIQTFVLLKELRSLKETIQRVRRKKESLVDIDRASKGESKKD
jgi:hypothetical protein